jgi:PEP-CTERM motif
MKMLHKILGCSAVAAAFAISASTTQAQNLLVNPGFESATLWTGNPITIATVGDGWDNNFGGSAQGQNDMSTSADSPYDGSYALLAANAPGNVWNPQGTYQIIANSSVGAAWSASVWALTDTGTQGAAVAGTGPFDFQVQFLDSTLANISTADYGWSPLAALDTWQQFTMSGTVPAGTAYISVYDFAMIGPGAAGNVNVYFDDNSLTVAPEPTTLALAGLGGVSLLSLIRRRKS